MKTRVVSLVSGRNRSIRAKLMLVILGTCSISVMIAAAALFAFTWQQERKLFSADVVSLTEIVAANLVGPLAFNDRKAASEVLQSLRSKSEIRAAVVRLSSGTMFASLRDTAVETDATGNETFDFRGTILNVRRPITVRTEVLGTVELSADCQALFDSSLRAFLTALSGIAVVALLVAFTVGSALQRIILRPIQRLVETAKQVATGRDYRVRAIKVGDDELGVLTDAFNHMLQRIEEDDSRLRIANSNLAAEMKERSRLTSELVAISRRAGMAEVATGVLHNVGNVLNSVNTSASVVQSQLANSKTRDLARAVALIEREGDKLADFITHDARGRHLPKYLVQVSGALVQEQQGCRNELELLTKNIEHIKEIVAMQQSYARVSGVVEHASPVDVMEEALRITRFDLERHGIVVERQFMEVPKIEIDRHKVLQILINLVTNAKHALNDSASNPKQVTVKVANCGDTVALTVCDNGVGIAPENLTKIFAHGFTTRAGGHGFGLHMGALSARELGGSLNVHSAGVGRGASFTLHLPVRSKVTPATLSETMAN